MSAPKFKLHWQILIALILPSPSDWWSGARPTSSG
jgi:hypothetical protein